MELNSPALRADAATAPWWRRALAGLTPQVLAIIVALLFIRMASATVELLLVAVNRNELGAWIGDLFSGFPSLVLMTIPMLVIITATANLGPRGGWRRIAALAVAVVGSAGIGCALRLSLWFVHGSPDWDAMGGFVAYIWPRYAILGGMLTVAAELHRHEADRTSAARQAELDAVALEREMIAARLQVMQAQIEPHFFFNTLANVRRLYAEDHAAGRTMLDKFMRYLEVALPRMRDGEATLAHEAELIEAFLHIHRIRMGARLAFCIDIPPGLRAHPVPPMLLLTLVENAIKHGLNPSRDGGRIRVGAREDGGRLVLTVADTGFGFASGSGEGTGLANVSARLAAQFGDRASLVLENNELGGATPTIELQLERFFG
jgi:signal transduction histidine kinase